MDQLAFLLSIVSTIVALLSVYISQFKKGRVVIPPIRAYYLEPLNMQEGRAVRMYITLCLMNTGAQNKAISDLRVRVQVTDEKKELILQWENECPTLHCKFEDMQFASQPTLAPYESISRIYTFISGSGVEQCKLVEAVEKLCQDDNNKVYPATIEMREPNNRWRPLCKLAFRHSGRVHTEKDYTKINIY